MKIPKDGRDLVLRGVGKSYGSVQVLEPTDLHVRSGEFLTIVGPSGSGKTTLLRVISGFVEASCGTVDFAGEDLTRVPPHKRPFNTVFQDYALFPHMTVGENVGYGMMIRRQPREEIRRRTSEALAIVGLDRMLDRKPSQLSGGQRQRVALARALVCEPKVLLLDEPLSALDAEMRYQMQVFLKDLQRRVHTTFILVTHDQEEAITMSDRIAVMSAGRIEQIGTHEEVYYAPRTRFVAGFFGDNNLIDATALGNGSLETPFGRMPHVGGRTGMREKVLLSLRPEAIRVASPEPDAARARPDDVDIVARIRKATFAGPLTRIVASPENDPALELLVKVNSAERTRGLEVGREVRLTFSPRDVTIVSGHRPEASGPAPAARPQPVLQS